MERHTQSTANCKLVDSLLLCRATVVDLQPEQSTHDPLHSKSCVQWLLGAPSESSITSKSCKLCHVTSQVLQANTVELITDFHPRLFGRYLKRIDDALNSVKTQTDGAPVTMLAHSAGGWLSRVYLLSYGTTGIDRLVTIGSPHSPPPQVRCGNWMSLWQKT